MRTSSILTAFALALFSAPLSAQITVQNDRIQARGSAKVPRGHLPPEGMCRLWIDGVPPGQQPPVTDCATAERNRVANSRVIYGDESSFPGRGHGKFKRAGANQTDRRCTLSDIVLPSGRVMRVCREGDIRRDRRDRTIKRVEDDDDDDEELEEARKAAKSKAKARKAGKAAKQRERDD